MFIENVMRYCRNFFVKRVYKGSWIIADGSIQTEYIPDGAFFLIEGSLFNDGVYQFNGGLVDEEFEGVVSILAPPAEFQRLVDDIVAWLEEYEKEGSALSPYSQESFSDYSYKKPEQGVYASWQNVFKKKLCVWRKL